MSWTTYAVIGLLVVHADALLCFALKRRFRMWPSLIAGALWPLVLPAVILGAFVLTRNMPSTKVPLSNISPGARRE